MSTQEKTARRTFLAGLGAAAAASVAAKLASQAADAPPPADAAPADPPGPGYRLTQHIQKYYRTTRL